MIINKKLILILAGVGVLFAIFNTRKAPNTKACGIENCHGLEVVCGPNPAEICTMMYQTGDICRQFAKCGVVGGNCQQIENPRFSSCKACVQECEKEFPNDSDEVFKCESNCGE